MFKQNKCFWCCCLCLALIVGCGGTTTDGTGAGGFDVQFGDDSSLFADTSTTDVAKDGQKADVAGTGCSTDPECAGQTVGACETAKCVQGTCKAVAVASGTACDDKSACTDSDQCAQGKCTGTPKKCDDQSTCTTDACQESDGTCVYTPADGSCDDGNLCTTDDACKAGKCEGKANPACDCKNDADCAKTDDADLCNGIHTCQAGICKTKVGSEVVCDSSKAGACEVIACDTKDGKCKTSAAVAGQKCTDGDKCQTSQTCSGTVCKGTAVVCDDNNPCTDDSCNPKSGCVFAPNTAKCEDGDLCTNNDVCAAGKCAGTANPNCSKCTADADCAKFENGDLCDGTLVCTAGVCAVKADTVVTCPADANPCKLNACAPTTGKCAVKDALNGSPCDDGDKCNGGDRCEVGACVAGKALVCDDGNGCTKDSCDKATGCVYANQDGTTCDDGNSCTGGDACTAGKCAGTDSGTCAKCTTDKDCAGAEDGNLCNGTLKCTAGQCVINVATVVTCDNVGLSPCVKSECAPATGQCKKTTLDNGVVCDDSNACTQKDYCSAGICKGQPVFCDDGQLCTDDACDPDTGCTHAFNTAPCDDGSVCTTGDACKNGACAGTPAETCVCSKDADCVDDGDLCNGTPVCAGQKCVTDPKTVVSCPAPADACSANTCDGKTGKCNAASAEDGKPCDDKNACTSGEACGSGTCKGGTTVTCDDKNICSNDKCNPDYGCTYASNTASCDDGNACTTGDVCAYGKCQPGKPLSANDCADKCAPSYALGCGSVDSWGNGAPGSTKVISQYACNTKDLYDGPEYTYTYTAPYSGTMTATLTKETAETDLFILDGAAAACDAKACMAWGYASATATVTKGETYYVVVDGLGGADGKFTLDISCIPEVETACADGVDEDADGKTDCTDSDCAKDLACAAPTCDPAYTLFCGSKDNWATYSFGSTDVITGYQGCNNNYTYGGPEYAYTFTAKTSGKVTAKLSNLTADTDLILLGDKGDTCQSNQCLAYTIGTTGLTFDAVAGSTYYLLVDGYNGAEGKYTIQIDCETAVPTEICGNQIDDDKDGATDCVDSECFNVSKDCQPACVPDTVELATLTCSADKDFFKNDGKGSTNAITSYGCNPSYDYAGNEYAYTYVAEADMEVEVTLSNESAETDILVLTDTGLGCNPASCLTAGTSSAIFSAKKGTTYYIVVDGYKGANGDYDLVFACK